MTLTFTTDELDAIKEALRAAIADGFAESDEDPVVQALIKVETALGIPQVNP
jgi:hypothetical protein